MGSFSFDERRAYKAAWLILSANMHLHELNIEDFNEWFNQLAMGTHNSDDKYIDIKSKEG